MGWIISWFSCGAASAVSTMLLLKQPGPVVIARCVVDNEHEDNERFTQDCERLYGQPILRLGSTEFADCWEVWEKRRFIAGIKGAPCTIEMKKSVRWKFEQMYAPDKQAFGFTAEEHKRAARFREQNPDVNLLTPLIEQGVSKADCFRLLEGVGIRRPVMYDLGFANNNCICCGKATSIIYWSRCRHYFPDKFWRMAELSRRLGARLTRLKGVRIFLDEIPLDIDWRKKDREKVECGILCAK